SCPPPAPSADAPRNNLPRDTRDFTGRTAELAALLAEPGEQGSALPVTVVSGMPGIGKTALALHAAHRLGDAYPDAQLYVDLRGHSDEPPCEPAEALSLLLRVAGALDDAPPSPLSEESEGASVQARSCQWREWTARHRTLLVLDNAGDPDHIRPLLPGSAACRVIVTSRSPLTALEGADSLVLGVLPDSDAAALFARIAGDTRALDPAALRRAVGAFAGHPLAIQLLANGFRQHESWDLPYLADRLSRASDPLDELEADTVSSAFRLSYAALGAPARLLLCRLALHPGPTLAPGAVAALMGARPGETRAAVSELLHGHLIAEPERERYALHDLTRAFARRTGEDAETGEPARDRHAAVTRVLAYYLTAADRADRLVNPRRRRLLRGPEGESPYAPEFTEARDAWQWLSAERPNLLAATRTAAARFPAYAAHYSHVLAQTLKSWGWDAGDTGELHAAAVAALRERGDRTGLAQTLVDRADALAQEDPGEALRCASEALALFRADGDVHGCADALLQRGRAQVAAGCRSEAHEALDESLRLYQSVGAVFSEARALNVRGASLYYLGDSVAARACFEKVLDIYSGNYLFDEATALNNLGMAYLLEGRHTEALHYFEEALQRVRDCGGPLDRALTEANIGAAHHAMGDLDRALGYFHRALKRFPESGDSTGESDVRVHIGDVYASVSRYDEALNSYQRAEELASRVGAAYERQRALVGIAGVRRAKGEMNAAMRSYETALSMARSAEYALGSARALDGMARTALEFQGPESARRYADEAIVLYSRFGAEEKAGALRGLLDGLEVTGS
ncbi:tetratricopeptide repeat protein, partial [Streptomyces boncukensis]